MYQSQIDAVDSALTISIANNADASSLRNMLIEEVIGVVALNASLNIAIFSSFNTSGKTWSGAANY